MCYCLPFRSLEDLGCEDLGCEVLAAKTWGGARIVTPAIPTPGISATLPEASAFAHLLSCLYHS